MGQAALDNMGQRFRGEVRYGNAGMQMGHSMRQSAEMLKENCSGGIKPEAPRAPDTVTNSIQPDTAGASERPSSLAAVPPGPQEPDTPSDSIQPDQEANQKEE
jgi:hypothetical protein